MNPHLPLAVVQSSYAGVTVVAREDDANLGVGAGVLPHARLYRHLVVIVVGWEVVNQWRRPPLKATIDVVLFEGVLLLALLE